MFPVHTTPEKLDLCLTQAGKSHGYRDAIIFRKVPFSKCFLLHQSAKLAFSNSSRGKSVFEELRFRDGLVQTVCLEIKLRFKISQACC